MSADWNDPRRTAAVPGTGEEVASILRRVGWVLILLETANILWAIVEFVRGTSRALSVDLAAIVAGVFLIRGSLVTARYVAWWSAFFATAIVALPLGLAAIFPSSLLAVWWRTERRVWIETAGWLLVAFVALAWACRQLRSAPVREAQAAAGQKPLRIGFAIAAGAGLVFLLAGIMSAAFTGETAQEAIRRAREQKGPKYRYAVTSLTINNSDVDAIVVAYDDRSSESVEVSWTKIARERTAPKLGLSPPSVGAPVVTSPPPPGSGRTSRCPGRRACTPTPHRRPSCACSRRRAASRTSRGPDGRRLSRRAPGRRCPR